MHHISRLIGVFATILLFSWATMGCVDQEASLKLRGVVAIQGTQSTTEVDCSGEEEEAQPIPKPSFTCDSQVEPGNAENFLTQLSVDISEYENAGGQLAPANNTVVSDEQFCEIGPAEYQNQRFRSPSFVAAFDSINRLEDSREVGSQGQGGGGGGFSGLELNMNDVQTRTFKVRFPNVSETGPSQLGLDRDIDFTMVVDSGGGGAAFTLELLSRGDIQSLKQLHETVVLRRTGLSSYDDTAKKTAVTLTSEMWIEGETIGGRPVESNKLTFPVKLCGQGCGLTPQCNFRAAGGG